jgi:hypothetical protein
MLPAIEQSSEPPHVGCYFQSKGLLPLARNVAITDADVIRAPPMKNAAAGVVMIEKHQLVLSMPWMREHQLQRRSVARTCWL